MQQIKQQQGKLYVSATLGKVILAIALILGVGVFLFGSNAGSRIITNIENSTVIPQ